MGLTAEVVDEGAGAFTGLTGVGPYGVTFGGGVFEEVCGMTIVGRGSAALLGVGLMIGGVPELAGARSEGRVDN